MIKTFESFEIDNSKIWIVGIPSGEALQVSRDSLDSLYKEKLIHYNIDYVSTGFYAFHDEDIDLVKRYVEPKVVKARPLENKDIMIFKNNYNDNVLDSVLSIIEEFDFKIELYIQDDTMGITYSNQDEENSYFYIEINITNIKNAAKYRLIKKYDGNTIDRYNVLKDSDLIERIKKEMNKRSLF